MPPRKFKNIVVLTGAGISAESGIATFRGLSGMWNDHPIEKVATPEGFRADPALVHQFYNQRRAQLQSADIKPNLAHLALAEWEQKGPGTFVIVTQNIDNLHERAGSQNVIHMHGELLKLQCNACHAVLEWTAECTTQTACPACQRAGKLRPYVVWFGEVPRFMDEITDAISRADLFVSIGSSGLVYPAAGFGRLARQSGAHTLEINLEVTGVSGDFLERLTGPAGGVVPKFVAECLQNS